MTYRNRDLKKLELPMDELEFLRKGGTATVFRYEDKIYKEYFHETSINCTLKPDVYDVLKTIDSKNLMKIYDIYSNANLFKLYIDRFLQITFEVKAYIAQYYEEESLNILSKPIEYFLDNCARLDELAGIMADNSVVMYDLKAANSVLTTDDIVIVDPDYFSLTTGDRENTLRNNKEAVLNLLHDIFAYSITQFLPIVDLVQHYENSRIAHLHLNDFFEIQLTHDTDIAYELSKKIRRVKKPIDYFIDKL